MPVSPMGRLVRRRLAYFTTVPPMSHARKMIAGGACTRIRQLRASPVSAPPIQELYSAVSVGYDARDVVEKTLGHGFELVIRGVFAKYKPGVEDELGRSGGVGRSTVSQPRKFTIEPIDGEDPIMVGKSVSGILRSRGWAWVAAHLTLRPSPTVPTAFARRWRSRSSRLARRRAFFLLFFSSLHFRFSLRLQISLGSNFMFDSDEETWRPSKVPP